MTATDQQKVIAAGFTIIRIQAAENDLRIKMKGNGGHEWKTLEKGFATRAALDRRVTELLKDRMTVED